MSPISLIRIVAVSALLLLASLSSAAAGGGAPLDARPWFASRGVSGGTLAQDVRSGTVVAAATVGDGAGVLPLSIVKLFIAAIYLKHRHELPLTIAPDMHVLIARGWDDPGRALALQLRHTLGSRAMLADLGAFGLPACRAHMTDCTTLTERTADRDWAEALSLGETGFRTSPRGLCAFLRAIALARAGSARHPILSPAAAAALRLAMLETVSSGTASGVAGRLGMTGMLGGKTGTGPAGSQPYDGIFAGTVEDAHGAARIVVVTYVRRGGFGGGSAADISADLAMRLLTAQRPGHRP